MIITHKLNWSKCLSHQIWPAIEKGWPDEGRPVHFFWGLAGNNISEIRKCMELNEEYYFVDTGYISKPIHRYPEPKILDEKRTYFRICKGSFHTNKGKVNTPERLERLKQLGIDAEFKGWRDTGKHILLCPSSPTVTFQMNGITQDEWVEVAKREIRKHTDREIRVRVKKIKGQYNPTPLHEDLKDAHAVVSFQSSAAAKAIIKGVPSFTITDKYSAAIPMSLTDLSKIETPIYPENRYEWLSNLANHQFYANEIQSGYAKRYLDEQDT